jgi:hypothetical protein
MSHNDNTAAQTLLFLIQEASMEELDTCTDSDVLYFQARLQVTKVLNLVRAGKIIADDALRQDVEGFNQLCRETGYPTVHVDFVI